MDAYRHSTAAALCSSANRSSGVATSISRSSHGLAGTGGGNGGVVGRQALEGAAAGKSDAGRVPKACSDWPT